MSRALSLTCAALLLVGLGGTAFAKPSIAVLGLEVIEQNGTPSSQDTQAAKELSEGLRARAKAGTGPYQLAPGSDKELIDLKLLNTCDTEAPSCMSAIGNQLGSDVVMYGHFEKKGKNYQVTIWVLDVGRKAVLKTSSDLIPVGDASGASLQGWAKKLYAKLVGDASSGGTLVIKVSNADRGTILIDGDQKGTFSNGTGTVTGLGEGKVRVGIESEGFRRWEKDVTISGGSQSVSAELESGGSPPPPCTTPDCQNPPPPPPPGGKSNLLWKIGVGFGAVVAIGGGIVTYSGYKAYNDERDEQCRHGVKPVGSSKACTATDGMWTQDQIDASNDRGQSYANRANIGWAIAGTGAAIALISMFKVVTSSDAPAKERQSARGKRQRKERTFVVTPVMSREGGGATLRFDW